MDADTLISLLEEDNGITVDDVSPYPSESAGTDKSS
jgi:hypothetical protein